MCFSPEADLVGGLALLPVAAVSLRAARSPRELPFAALPLLFSAHQLTEVLVWQEASGHVSAGVQQAAALLYVLVALPLLPLLLPLAVTLLEPPGGRRRVAPFVALGAVVAARFAFEVFRGPLTVRQEPHALVYHVGLHDATLWTALYVVAVIGPSLLSGHRWLVAFGVANLVGLVAVALAYREAFASLWCLYAAATSVLVALHLVLRPRSADGTPARDDALARA